MKRYMFIFVYLFILFFGIKVEAITGANLSVRTLPEETVAGQYVTLSLNFSGKQNLGAKIIISFNYDTEYLQLVGFEKGNDSSCSYSIDEITCSSEGTLYPVFKIKKDFSSNQSVNVVVRESMSAPSGSSVATITKKEKIITVSSIEVEDYKNTLSIGESVQLMVTVLPDNARDKSVTYTSNNNDVLTVSDSGLVNATGEGEGTVVIKSGDIEKTVRFTVMKDPVELKEIKVKESNITLNVGDKKRIIYTLDPTDASVKEEDINIKSSDENVAVIDKDLNIHAMGAGEAKITINAGLVKTEIKVTVEEKKTKEKKSSPIVPCIITAIVTCILTIIGMFLLKLKKGGGSGPRSSPSINENGDFNFDM
ncbi:MAG: Ig-like domain-containing protein [Bacilli bacterium]|nr:Ig-like domain-containing protein [Bacilli bacterium]